MRFIGKKLFAYGSLIIMLPELEARYVRLKIKFLFFIPNTHHCYRRSPKLTLPQPQSKSLLDRQLSSLLLPDSWQVTLSFFPNTTETLNLQGSKAEKGPHHKEVEDMRSVCRTLDTCTAHRGPICAQAD